MKPDSVLGSYRSHPRALQELTDEYFCILNIYLNSLRMDEIPEDLKRADVLFSLIILERIQELRSAGMIVFLGQGVTLNALS